MSMEALRNFEARLQGDAALAGRVKTAMAGKTGPALAEAFVTLAAREGFHFTAVELQEGAGKKEARHPAKLEDADLDAVAGGSQEDYEAVL